ncbi:MAG: Holliday junction branch migration protein RuvA [Clostridia bacterium]|nr:Holliday junction branch migration protein RuvA [Clostridia bacterium]
MKCEPAYAVIDCGGVGYKLYITGTTLGRLAGKVGQQVTLLTHMKVSEDSVELYGFHSEAELDTFRLLISVSGVGTKSAASILTLMTPERLAAAISASDAKSIAKAQGIGSKTAARIVLELKDKLGVGAVMPDEDGAAVFGASRADKLSDALETLIALGYTRRDAQSALSGIKADELDLEEIVKQALKRLMR